MKAKGKIMRRINDMLRLYREEGRTQLTEAEGKELLSLMGIEVPKGVLAESLQEACEAAEQMGYPVVLKGQLRQVTHKSDLGLVQTGIKDRENLTAQYSQIASICEDIGGEYKILIEKMAEFDTEFIVSLNEDPVFGRVLMFGLGGIFVEAMRDVRFAVCPITREDAYRMVRSLRCHKLLEGIRGGKPVDMERLVDVLMLLGGEDGIYGSWGDQIKTLEINPIVFDADGAALALDAVVTLQAGEVSAVGKAVRDKRIDMDSLFMPRAIAVVGVSNKASMAAIFLKCTMEAGYGGDIYPVNPNCVGEKVMGHNVYASLRDIPGDVDYVYVAIPAKGILEVIEDAVAKRVSFVHIISGGFAEAGEEGRRLEYEIARKARAGGIRLIGPNCMGMVSTPAGIVFTTGVGTKKGGVSLVSQSGGIATEMLRAGNAQGIWFNKAVSIGNCADLGIEDFLCYLEDDSQTKVIGIYSENLRDGNAFYRSLRRAAKKKPVVVLVGGRSNAGAKAAASHTGALASNYAVWQAMCEQCGVTLVHTLEEFLNALMAFQNLKPSADNRVLLVSHSGGVAVTSTDLCEDYGLSLPKLEQSVQQELLQLELPPGANVSNPMDISLGVMAAKSKEGDDIHVIGDVFQYVSSRASYDYYVFYLMADNVIESGGGRALIRNIVDFAIEWGGYGGAQEGHFILAANSHTNPAYIKELCVKAQEAGVTVFPNINEMLQSIGWVTAYGRWRGEGTDE